MRSSSILATAGVAAVLSACGPSVPSTEQGVSLELAAHRRATLSDLSYDIRLVIPREREEPITGFTAVTLRWDDPDGKALVLDFVDPGNRVESVIVNGSEAAWEPVNDHIVIDPEPLFPGVNRIELRYRAGDEALNRNDDFLYALFVPDRAHFSLPVFDQPNLKATVAWTLKIPGDWTAVGNGPVREQFGDGSVRTIRLKDSRPIPTYLFAFAAGRFEVETGEADGRAMRVFHRETDKEKVGRNLDAVFDLHGRALSWLEEYTGIPYPFQKFDIVLIPSFQYGGMEHPGGILYRQAGLMLDETATQGQILGRASVIAHETAHMWFGDLVTMDWFDDVWTKEVFANFMAAKIVHPSFPSVNHDLRFLLAHHPAAYAVDRTDGANPIRQPLENLRFAGTLYGAIIYQKAPIVMRHLESRVGPETFREGLQEYLQTYSYGNATWPDLIEIMDRRTPEDLTTWSRVWVEEPGRPEITVERDGDDVVLSQSDPRGRGLTWPQTLGVRLGYDARDTLVVVESRGEPVRLVGMGGAGMRFALPNGTGVEYGGFRLDPDTRAFLVGNMAKITDPLTRGAAWVDLWEEVLDGRLPPGTFLDAALDALGTETDELNLARILGYLSAGYWRLMSPETRTSWAPRLEAAVWAGVTGPLPRTARSSFFSTYRDVAATDEAVDRLRRLWAGGEHLPGITLGESDHIALATALAIRGVPDAEDILDEQGRRIRNPDRKARFDFVRASLSGDPAVRETFFEGLRDAENREREPWALEGLDNLHHPLRARESTSLVYPALEMLEEVQRTGDIFFPGRWVDAVLGGHQEPEAAEIVRNFLDAHPDLSPRLRAKVLQSADMLYRSATIVNGWDGGRP